MHKEENELSSRDMGNVQKSPTDQLPDKLVQCPPFVRDLLEQADHCLDNSPSRSQQRAFLAPRAPVPFREILSLLKDGYNGKMNDYLQEILDSAETELTVRKGNPNDPQSPQQLEIKIVIAAAVINKYAGLLKMVIGEKTKNKDEAELIETARKTVDLSKKKFRRINLMYGISQLEQQLYDYISEHQSSHCLPFLCSGKTVAKYKRLARSLSALLSESFSGHEIAGGLYMIRSETKILSDAKIRETVSTAIKQVLVINGYPVEEEETASKFIKFYTDRVAQLNERHEFLSL